MDFNLFQNNNMLRSAEKYGYKLFKFTDIAKDDTRNGVKIKKEDYLENGAYPIIDQGKEFVSGYYNEDNGLYEDIPAIIFGDHTRNLKYIDFPIFLGADGVKIFKIIPEINTKYIYYFLLSVDLPNDGYSRHSKYLKEVIVPVPEIDTQNKIVEILDKAQELIDKRKEQMELLEELVQSKFIELFGEPVLNPKGWDVKNVIEVCDCMVPGRDKPKSFTGDTPWITIEDLEVNGITYKSKSSLGLTDEEINQVKRKKIPKGSVIMSCVGNLGICSIAGTDVIINQQLHSFQCKDINNVFLMHYLGFRKDYMKLKASSTTVLYMNKTVCNSIPVYLPPLELQEEFADFVGKVNDIKTVLNKSLEQLNNNFDSLISRAFKGELF